MDVSEIVKGAWKVAFPFPLQSYLPYNLQSKFLFKGSKYRNFIIAPIWFISNAGFVSGLTVRSCIPDSWFLFDGPTGGWQWGLMGRRQSAASVTDRVHWLLSGEKDPFWGHLPPVQKLSESLGLALPSSPPALRGSRTSSHRATSARTPASTFPSLISQNISVSAPRKGWISLFSKNSFPGIFPEEINYFVAKKDLCHIFTK